MLFLTIDWSSVGIKIAQLLLSLSILVILHEFGHYITARWFKCRVEKFYLFFNPWFSLVKKKVGVTEYGIGWVPLGGYVKIAGMVDESMDKTQLKQPPQPWEFRSKPAWQRLIIMLGGVTVNVLLAFIIYAMILFVWGETKLPVKNIKNGIWCIDSLANQLGLQTGDKILSVNDKPVEYFDDINAALIVGDHLTIERKGLQQNINLPVNLIEKIVDKGKRSPIVALRIPTIVGEVPDTAAAYKAGLKPNDQIIGINAVPTVYFDEVRSALHQHKGDTVAVHVQRGNAQIILIVPVSAQGTIGFVPLQPDVATLQKMGLYQFDQKKYGFFASFPAGVIKAGEKLDFYIQQFKKILNPKTGAYKGVGGFKSMGSVFPSNWDWQTFWNITAFFSIVLAFMNLLPIPALDGGHVLFTLYEMITRRKPNQKFLEYAQYVGMIILLALLLYANGNDWFGWNK